jgi:hypothetical protein
MVGARVEQINNKTQSKAGSPDPFKVDKVVDRPAIPKGDLEGSLKDFGF